MASNEIQKTDGDIPEEWKSQLENLMHDPNMIEQALAAFGDMLKNPDMQKIMEGGGLPFVTKEDLEDSTEKVLARIEELLSDVKEMGVRTLRRVMALEELLKKK